MEELTITIKVETHVSATVLHDLILRDEHKLKALIAAIADKNECQIGYCDFDVVD